MMMLMLHRSVKMTHLLQMALAPTEAGRDAADEGRREPTR
jgi:hypothetical protein